MKKYYAVTISDIAGSRYLFVKTAVVRTVIVASVAFLGILFTLFITNRFQSDSVELLSFEKSILNKQLIQADYLISNFEQRIANNQQQATNISKELVAIEQLSGVDMGDLESSLDERIKRIKNFYNAREEEYSEIGNRVGKIEQVIGVGIGIGDESTEQHPNQQRDLAARVDLAGLTAMQERILHDNIPNGYPLKDNVITSKFGMRNHPVTKVKSFHNGLDLRAKTNTEIFAPADGIVSNADYSNLSGNRIVILHNFGFETRYYHLKKAQVSPGEMIHKGDLIGYSGNTGRSLAAHLHYEIRYLRKPINPYHFLEWEFGSHEIFTQVKGIKWHSLISLINKQITHQTLQLSQLERTSQVK